MRSRSPFWRAGGSVDSRTARRLLSFVTNIGVHLTRSSLTLQPKRARPPRPAEALPRLRQHPQAWGTCALGPQDDASKSRSCTRHRPKLRQKRFRLVTWIWTGLRERFDALAAMSEWPPSARAMRCPNREGGSCCATPRRPLNFPRRKSRASFGAKTRLREGAGGC